MTSAAYPPPSRTGRRLLAAGLLLPLAELAVAIWVGRLIGAPLTVLLLLGLSVTGGYVLRRAGVRAAGLTRRPAASPAARPEGGVRDDQVRGDQVRDGRELWGRDQRTDVADAACLFSGGVLLLVPGFLTALAGALLALPPTRRLLRPLLGRAVTALTHRLLGTRSFVRVMGKGSIIEGQVVVDAGGGDAGRPGGGTPGQPPEPPRTLGPGQPR